MNEIVVSSQKDLENDKITIEYETVIVSYYMDRYVLIDFYGAIVCTLSSGDTFDLLIGGRWQTVMLKSGGYKGWYYETVAGERGRVALCARSRQLTLTNEKRKRVCFLSAGEALGLLVGDRWQLVRLESDGYEGWYYTTEANEHCQLALGTRAILQPLAAREAL